MKRLMVALGIILVLAGGVAGGAWYLLSRFDARAEIVRRVTLATGRTFEIKGPVSVSFWPVLGFRGADVALANAPGGVAPHLLEAREIAVGVAIQPLLHQRLEIASFALLEPRLNLEVDASGHPNWLLGPPTAPAPRTPPPATSAPTSPAKPSAAAQDLKLTLASIEGGTISFRNARQGTSLDLSDVSLKTSLQGLDKPQAISGVATFNKQPVKFDVSMERARAAITGAATPVTLKIDAVPLNATFTGRMDFGTGALSGGVSAQGPSLRTLTAWIGAPLGDGKTLQAFQLSGNVTVGPKRYAFENAAIQVDEVKARGDFLFEQAHATPLLSGRLEILSIDLNPYLASPAPQQGAVQIATIEPVNVAAPAGWSEAPIDLGGLKRLNANLDLTTGPITFNKIHVDHSKMGLVLTDGYLASTLSELTMYGGQGSGRFEVDARTPVVTVRNDLAVQHIKARDFFGDAIGFRNIDGTARIDWGLVSSGGTQKQMMSSLRGDGEVLFENGGITGVDLGGVARTIRNALRRELVAPTAQTRFSRFGARFRAQDGVIATDSVALEATDAKLSGIGTVDAGRRAIDMRLVPKLGAMGLAVPFRVNGAWDHMIYASDILGRAKGEVESKARVVLGRTR